MEEQEQKPGEAIKQLRLWVGLSQKEVAAGAKTSVAYLSRVENGNKTPSISYVAQVVKFIMSQVTEVTA